jgi:bacteriocin biosynthesis cyclodehydratase domain-containing protein
MNESGWMYPALNTAAGVIPLPDGRLQVRTPSGRLTIGREAQLAKDLFGLCDGKRSIDEIVVSLRERGYPDAQTRELCRYLARRFVLMPDAPPECDDVLLAHAWHFSKHTENGAEKAALIADDEVQVCGSGHLANAVREDLTRLHIQHSDVFDPEAEDVSLIVICSDFENHVSFRERNRAAVSAAQPIFFACIAETAIRLGPLVVPKETSCFECFHHRLRANLAFRDEFDGFIEHNAFLEESGIDGKAGIYARLGSGFVCTQVLHFLLGTTQHCLADKLVEVSPITVELFSSRVLKLPRCEVCGHNDEQAPPAARDWV